MSDMLRAVVFDSNPDVSDYTDLAEQAAQMAGWEAILTRDPDDAVERLAGSAALIASLWTRDIADAVRTVPVLPAARLIAASNGQLHVPRLILSPGLGGRLLVRPGSQDAVLAKENAGVPDRITDWLRSIEVAGMPR